MIDTSMWEGGGALSIEYSLSISEEFVSGKAELPKFTQGRGSPRPWEECQCLLLLLVRVLHLPSKCASSSQISSIGSGTAVLVVARSNIWQKP